MRTLRMIFAVGTLLMPAASLVADDASSPAPQASASVATSVQIDPTVFFQKLVDRYRGLNLYRDVVTVVQVTQRDGQETSRVETRITCEVSDGELKVKTPASEARDSLKLDLPMKQAAPVNETKKKYDLWLAPHMTLKFADQPLKELRAGVEESFKPTDAEHITIANKSLIHVELRSGPGEGGSDDFAAKVDLYVNSDSMLIERVESHQRLPDGASYSTTLEITPQEVEEQPTMPAEVDDNSPVR